MQGISDAINPSVMGMGWIVEDKVKYWQVIRQEAYDWIMSDDCNCDYPSFVDMATLAFEDPDYAIGKIRDKVINDRKGISEKTRPSRRGKKLLAQRRIVSNPYKKTVANI
jgi:hypothetical protein